MKLAFLAPLAALGLIATPVLAATPQKAPVKTTKVMKTTTTTTTTKAKKK